MTTPTKAPSARRRAGSPRGPKQAVLSRSQKALLHIYKAAADLPDHQYRDILRRHAGVPSAADHRITQAGFESAMAALEAALFDRVRAGLVPDPTIGANRYIHSEEYWRNKIAARGAINSRQLWKIDQLWTLLLDYLPEDARNQAYFRGIIKQSTKRHLDLYELTNLQAGHLIDALKDRLAHALSGRPA